MQTLLKIIELLATAKGDSFFKLFVTLMFVAWSATEGLSYWYPDLALGKDRVERLLMDHISKDAEHEVRQAELLEMLGDDYVQAHNNMNLMEQRYNAELRYIKERQNEQYKVLEEKLNRHERLLERISN